MTDADTTLTTYVVQFRSITGPWIDAAHGPFNHLHNAQAWIDEHIPTHTSRIIKRTVTDEVVSQSEDVA